MFKLGTHCYSLTVEKLRDMNNNSERLPKDNSAPILLDQQFSNFFLNHRILVQIMSFLDTQGQKLGCWEGRGSLRSHHCWVPQSTAPKPLSTDHGAKNQSGTQTRTGSRGLPRTASLNCALTMHPYVSLWLTLEETAPGNDCSISYKDIIYQLVKDIIYLPEEHLLWENPK